MTKRGRWRLIIVLVVLGIPALVCLGSIGFVAGGGLESRLEKEYAARFPGRLEIGHIELAGTRHAIAHDVVLYGPAGGDPVVRIATADLQGGIFPPRLERIALTGLKLRFDRDAVDFVQAFLAMPRPARDSEAPSMHVDIDGEIAVAQRIVLSPLHLTLDFDRWALAGRLSAKLGGQPFELVFAPETGGDPLRRPSRIGIVAATVDLGDLFGAITALGYLPNQKDLLAWLPARASLAGAELVIDPAARTMSGHASPTWDGGRGNTDLLLDSVGLHLTDSSADDTQLGRGEGKLDVTIPDGVLTVELDRWQPGPRIPLPSAVPTSDLLKLLPAAYFTLHPNGMRVSLWCLPAGGARNGQRVALHWRRNAPLVIDATSLPLQMVQGFVPAGLRCAAGSAAHLLVEWEDHLQRLELTLADAELELGAWRLMRINGELVVSAVDPHDPTAGYSSRLDLPFGAVVHRGTPDAGELELTVARLDELVQRLRGPVPVPHLSGLLKVIGRVEHTPEAWRVTVKHLGLAGVQSHGALRELSASGNGNFSWNGVRLDAGLNGRLVSGEAALPSGWLDFCARQPLFTSTFSVDANGLVLHELLARASDRFGQPAADAFTAGLSGRLDADFSGRIDTVVDRLDLAWFTRTITSVPMPPATIALGESALTAGLTIVHGGIDQVAGWVLPLGVDLSLLGGTIDVSGISGSVKFLIERNHQP